MGALDVRGVAEPLREGMKEATFDFGANWDAFSDRLIDEGRLRIAMESLQTLLQRESLHGASVADVGCGSGLFSIAASKLGAERVIGLDINPLCIEVSSRNTARLAPSAALSFHRASVLSPAELAPFGTFDLVYAWGSLHHTGAMWEAIRNVTRMVAPGGTLVLAIYNEHATSPFWRVIKRTYNRVPRVPKTMMAAVAAAVIFVAKAVVTRRNPLEKERGMSFWYDVVDWVGGYPYEYASRSRVEQFIASAGFAITRFVQAQVPTGCNEYVFRRHDSPSTAATLEPR
jgi:2-polyprenyl-6-hydroxyphenyl methylase/3-demethylubiquinone-9 3-methyltransferase